MRRIEEPAQAQRAREPENLGELSGDVEGDDPALANGLQALDDVVVLDVVCASFPPATAAQTAPCAGIAPNAARSTSTWCSTGLAPRDSAGAPGCPGRSGSEPGRA
jgi:hypothetical protein